MSLRASVRLNKTFDELKRIGKAIDMGDSFSNKRLETSLVDWLIGAGEMTERIRLYNWSQSAIGARDQWPAALRFSIKAMLVNPFPTVILWGVKRILLYNDSFLKIAQKRHPLALGEPIEEVFPKIWNLIEPTFDRVRKKHSSVLLEDQCIPIRNQNDVLESAWFTLSHIPIDLENGQVEGTQITFIETTQHKRTEETLKTAYSEIEHKIIKLSNELACQSGERFKAIFEYAPILIDAFDAQGHCLLWNNECKKLFGWTLEEINATEEPLALFYPDPQIRAQVIATVTAEPERIFREWHPHNKKGEELTCMWANFKLPDGLVMNIGYDITASKQAEDALRSEKDQFRTMLDAIPQLAWAADSDGFIFLYNKRWYEYTGTTPEQMEGWGWQSVHDPEMLPKVLERWKRAIVTGQPFDMEFPIRGADGKFRWFLTRVLPLKNSKGQVVRWFGTNTDISGLKQIEEQLQRTSERLSLATRAAKVGIWDWDLVSNHLVWDDQMYQLYGIKPKQFTGVYEAWESSLHPDDLAKAREESQKALRGEGNYNSIFRVIWPDGSTHYIQAIGEVKKDQKGRIIGMTGTNWDITKLKKLENDLHIAVDLRDEFMAIASHELKTPLTALSMQIQLLMQIASKEDLHGKVTILSKKAYKSIKSLVNLVNDLLDVTRIRVGRLTIAKEEMDLRVAILKIISLMKEEITSVGVSIVLKADQPIIGKWDPKRIDQVFSNLLSNALKYGAGKPIEVTLTADCGSNLAHIQVKDYGIGISREMQTKIFNRFQRADSVRSIAGLGLGLYIVRQIVEAHGGSVRVESELGKGATFKVKLPLIL